ncbi:MAG: type II secretion system protein GspG [Myxococcota bacterium]
MARRKKREQTIFFPWERRGAWARAPWLRSRPAWAALFMIVLLLGLGARQRHQTGVRATRATLMTVRRALDRYRADHAGACPTNLSALREEGYLHIVPNDAWGRPLVLTCPGRRDPASYDLLSFGADGDRSGLERIE